MKTILRKLPALSVPVLAGAVILILFHTVFFIGYVPTASMEPAIRKGSYIFGSRLYGSLEAGDIVVFRREGRLLVKRIAAVGGETVLRNGIRLTVPDGCLYVLGDNAEISMDSRYWEEPFVEEGLILARIVWDGSVEKKPDNI